MMHYPYPSSSSSSSSPSSSSSSIDKEDFLAIDPSGTWLWRWDQQFQNLRIPFLRSLCTIHPDPLDSQSLFSYAFSKDPEELLPISSHTIDQRSFRSKRAKERSRRRGNHASDSVSIPSLYLPSSRVFSEFCHELVGRYHLDRHMVKEKVSNVLLLTQDQREKEGMRYKVLLSGGGSILTNHVVFAIGIVNQPRVPSWASQLLPSIPRHVVVHSKDLIDGNLDFVYLFFPSPLPLPPDSKKTNKPK